MPLDQKQLRDAKRLQKARTPTTAITGTTAAIRAALPAIRDLRKGGVAWSAIAEALAQQGVVQGKDRVPIKETRLTALVSQIEAQERRKQQSKVKPRSDTAMPKQAEQLTLSLLPAAPSGAPSTTADGLNSEHELRTAAFAKLQQSLFKKE